MKIAKIKLRLLALLIITLGFFGATHAAILDGKTVNYQYYYPDAGSPYSNADNGNKVVGSGIEVTNVADGTATMDISDSNIFIDFLRASEWNAAAFNGWVLTDVLGTISDFTSVTINSVTNMVGFDLSRISFDGDHIRVNWQGLAFDANTVVSLDVNASDVPEPATIALLGFGLLGIGAARRRKQA